MDDLLADLLLTGWVVTTDALFTQTAIAETILTAGGDYLMAVKGNQPQLLADLTTLFADPTSPVVQANVQPSNPTWYRTRDYARETR